MFKKTAYNHIALYCRLLLSSIVCYGASERILTEAPNILLINSSLFLFISLLMGFIDTKNASLQKISTPWLLLLLTISTVSSIKNILSPLINYSSNISITKKLLFEVVTHYSKSFSSHRLVALLENTLLTVMVVIPFYIALITIKALREKSMPHTSSNTLNHHDHQ